jgi:hypothetical protein
MVKSSALKTNACHVATVMTCCGVSQTVCHPGELALTQMSGLPSGPHVLPGFVPPTSLKVLSRHSHLGGVHEDA